MDKSNISDKLNKLRDEICEMARNYEVTPDIFPETMKISINFRTMTIETFYE